MKKLLLYVFFGTVLLHTPQGTIQGYVDTDTGTVMLHGPNSNDTIQGTIDTNLGTIMLHSKEGTTIGTLDTWTTQDSQRFKQRWNSMMDD